MTPTVTRTPTPALAALRRHVLGPCRYGGDAKQCNECRGLNADASAESWRIFATRSETTQRG
jgi:hypothetical protein